MLTTDANIVCVRGYASSVRKVPESLKRTVFLSYGITKRSGDDWEVDHLISLELGGSNSIRNLWPESGTTMPLNYRAKDSPLERISLEARKFGLGLILASQAFEHFPRDVLGNAATKIAMDLEGDSLARGARLLSISRSTLEGLGIGEAVVIAGKLEPRRVQIKAYSGRVKKIP